MRLFASFLILSLLFVHTACTPQAKPAAKPAAAAKPTPPAETPVADPVETPPASSSDHDEPADAGATPAVADAPVTDTDDNAPGTEVAQLLAQLDDADPAVRARAAEALGRAGLKDPAAIDRLIRAAFDENVVVRRAAIHAVRETGAPREVTRPLVVKLLAEADPVTIAAVIDTLAEDGKAAVPGLIDLLKHEQACYWACVGLAAIGPDAAEAAPQLIKMLQHEEPEVRSEALMALAAIGPGAQSATAAVVERLEKDEMRSVHYAAAYALAELGDPAIALAPLEKTVASDDAFLAMISAWALAKLDPDNAAGVRRAAEMLVAGLASDDPHLRRAAARGLGDLQGHAEIVGPALVGMLKDGDPIVVENALDALANLGPQVVPRAVARLDDPSMRPYALRLIQRIGPGAAEAVPKLVEMLESEDVKNDTELQAGIQHTLGRIGPAAKPAVEALIESLASDDDRVRGSAVFALAKIGPDAAAAVPKLREMLESGDDRQQLESAWALLDIEPGDEEVAKQAVPLLIEALQHERPELRAEAARTLGTLGALAQAAIEPLEQLRDSDEQQSVQEAAEAALAQIKK